LPYVLNVKDNWDHHEGRGQDLDTYQTAEDVVAAAQRVIDRSLRRNWKFICGSGAHPMTAESLYELWTWSGDNTYILELDGSPPVEPRFDPYDYAHLRAEEIAQQFVEVQQYRGPDTEQKGAAKLSTGAQTGPPIGVQKGPL
jgi:hypothetical protein